MMRHYRLVSSLVLGIGLCISATTQTWGQSLTIPVVAANEPQKLNLSVGKSLVLDLPVAVTRASLANPEIADALVLSPKQLYVTGKSAGVTNLTLWQDNQKIFSIFDVEVAPDLTRLKEQIHQLLQEEFRGISNFAHDTVSKTPIPDCFSRRHSVCAGKLINAQKTLEDS